MSETPRRLLALATLAATLAAPAARLAVDAGAPEPEDRVESSHEPGRCHPAHHHLACVQLFSSAAAPSAFLPEPPDQPGASRRPGLDVGRLAADRIPEAARPRAPPIRLV